MKIKKLHFNIYLLVLILSLSVAGTINQGFKPQYNLETPRSSAGEITIVTPENKSYTQPDSGYYPGTYSFDDEIVGSFGDNTNFIDEYYGSYVHSSYYYIQTFAEYDGHKSVLIFQDAQGGNYISGTHYIDSAQSSGTMEFFLDIHTGLPSGSIPRRQYLYFRALDDTIGFRAMIEMHDGDILYYDGSNWQEIASALEYATWYHHSISFDCNAGTNGLFTWIVSTEAGEEISRVENIEFENKLFLVEEMHFESVLNDYGGHCVYDAFGFSWDPNYNVGDNLNEGLLLSYDSSINLDWQGYSLDGISNRTIWGNTTIPMPTDGQHRIQVFGNDSLSTNYQSDLRYFTTGSSTENIEDWQYFREINLNPSTPESDYQVKVQLDNLNFEYSKANPDGSDIRFYDQNENLLSYWIEKWNITGTSIIWIKIPTSGTSIFYMYYGNPIANSLSNGITTFEFFDDFEGTSLNASNWNTEIGTYCGISVSSGYVRIYSDAPNTFAESTYFGFTDFYFNQGTPGWIHPSESITISIAEDTSWHTNEIRWTNLTSAPYYKNDVYVSEDTTLEDTTLTVRFLAHSAYAGPGTPWGAWIWTDDNTLGQMGRGLRTKTSVDLTDIADLRVDWVAVFKYSELNPAVTIGLENELGQEIIINAPITNSLHGTVSPDFNITISDPDYNFTWYSLDGGSINIYSNETTGTIDQTEWDKQSNGTVTITFYANNSLGNVRQAEVTVRKDIFAPLITINSPTENQVFGEDAPTFDLTILEHEINSTWYTLDSGNVNISFSGSAGTINQAEWEKKGGGTIPIRFYANDTFGNVNFSEVVVVKDLTSPIVSINSPGLNELFGSTPPNFDITVIESNPESMWYTLDSGETNVTFGSITGTINQTEWDKQGNGTVTVKFYARDEGGNEGFAEIIVRKEIIGPTITINSPLLDEIHASSSPSYSVDINHPNLDSMWYSLDDGATVIPFDELTGTIEQAEWNKYGNGTVTIKFFANDTLGNENFQEVMIRKDILAPLITINSPALYDISGYSPPNYEINVIDSQLDSMWYTLDNGLTIIPIVSTVGTIDQTEWEKIEGGSVPIRFHANDTLGNAAYSEVVINKDIFHGMDPVELLTPGAYSQIFNSLLNFSWSSLDAGFGAVNFTLQVSNVSDFSHVIFQSGDIAETPIFTNFSVPLSITHGDYYWRVRPTYGIYNGSWSDCFSFTLHVNDYAPNLALDDITPMDGSSSTIFYFTVIYSDLDNNAPEYVEILINGIPHSMELVDPLDDNFADGCIYQYLTLLAPSTTAYTISFECSDGAFQCSTSIHQGPLVEADSTPGDSQSDENFNSANMFAIMMTLGITVGGILPFIAFAEIKARKIEKLGDKTPTKIKKKELKS